MAPPKSICIGANVEFEIFINYSSSIKNKPYSILGPFRTSDMGKWAHTNYSAINKNYDAIKNPKV